MIFFNISNDILSLHDLVFALPQANRLEEHNFQRLSHKLWVRSN